MNTRRSFIQKSALGLSAAALIGIPFAKAESTIKRKARKEDPFKLGVAGWSFKDFNLEQSLAMMKRIDVHFLCIKDFHLPYKSTAAEIKAFHEQLAQSGVTGYAVGPIYTRTKVEIDNAFDYAKRVGVDLIIGIPKPEDLEYVSSKVKESGIRYAIHNHGPSDKLYPNATVIYNHIKNLDKGMGICLDIGHNARDGQDLIKDIERYHARIFDMHLKNVSAANKDGITEELGRGIIDIPAFVKTMRKVNYSGICALEHEKDMNDPLAGLAESTGYFNGVSAV